MKLHPIELETIRRLDNLCRELNRPFRPPVYLEDLEDLEEENQDEEDEED